MHHEPSRNVHRDRPSATNAIRCLAIPLIVGILSGFTAIATAQSPAPGALSDSQIRRILTHGPWPERWRPDPSNRVSGQAAAAEFGRRLFFDARLSPSGRFSCSSCHRPERGWSDGRPRGIGLQPSQRNTPSLFNARLNRWFGWSGAGDSLWAQSLRPLLDAGEMGSSAQHVRDYLASDQELAGAYSALFGRPAATTDAETVLVDAAKALAAYQETIVSGRTAFDEFRDALSAGDRKAAARYPLAARRGLAVFVGKGGCSTCHAGPAFTNGTFHSIGGAKGAAESPDTGRRDGIARLLASPYNLAGRFNDDPERVVTWAAAGLAPTSKTLRAFRVPSLRNLTRTGPYLHDGSLPTLAEAIRGHAGIGRSLADHEVADIVGFLETLSEAGR